MKEKLIIIMFFGSLVAFLFMVYLNVGVVLEEQEIMASLMVGEKAGFDINKTALTFGMITRGSNSNRNLIVENEYEHPIKLEFDVEGDIEDFLEFEDVVYLGIGENKTLSIHTITIDDEEYGNYSGKMKVVTKMDLLNE